MRETRGPLGGLVTAVGWFTRFPAPGPRTDADLARAVGWLPLVGLLVAAVGIAVRVSTIGTFGPLASAVMTVAATVIATGAYHEDGLADTFDGLWGGWNRERRLQILRDSRVGTYGAAALVLSLLLRVGLLTPLDAADSARALLVGHVLGRATVAPLLTWLPQARDDSAAAPFAGGLPVSAWLLVTVTALATTVAAVGVWAPLPLGLAALLAALMGLAAKRRLGGVTGDVLGAANQLAHIAAMAGVAAVVA